MGTGFFLQNFFLFLFPSLLTNKKLNLRILSDKIINQAFKSHAPHDLIFRNNSEQMKRILADYLVASPFLDHHFSLKRMSFELNIPEKDIVNYLKNNLHTNFVEWKNKLRLDHAIQLIDSGHSSFLTIQGIAHSVGIESRSKFNDLFKKNRGLTPSGYIKNRKI
jgi:AraC-like DNA-binding protein